MKKTILFLALALICLSASAQKKSELKTQIDELEIQLKSLRTEDSLFRANTTAEMNALKASIASLKESVNMLLQKDDNTAKIQKLENDMSQLLSQLKEMKEKNEELKGEIAELKNNPEQIEIVVEETKPTEEERSKELVGTYSFTDTRGNRWAVVLNDDYSKSNRSGSSVLKLNGREVDYGTWYFDKENIVSISYSDWQPYIYVPSTDEERCYHIAVYLRSGYMYIDDTACYGNHPKKRLKTTKSK